MTRPNALPRKHESLCGFLAILTVCLYLACTGLASADQRDPELDELFTSLKQASDGSQASQIESKIWQHWLQAPDSNSTALLSQVVSAMESGDYQLALKLCSQLVDSNPDFAEAWNKRATLQYLIGNHSRSVADIRETLALEPRHFGAISGLGLIFMRAGDLDAALAAFEQVLVISPQSESSIASIKRVREEMGREI